MGAEVWCAVAPAGWRDARRTDVACFWRAVCLGLRRGAADGLRLSAADARISGPGGCEIARKCCGDCPPAEDGGYGLIGLVDRVWPAGAALFEDVQWGTGQVMAQTRGNARRAGIPLVALPQIWDVDDARGWRRFLQQAP